MKFEFEITKHDIGEILVTSAIAFFVVFTVITIIAVVMWVSIWPEWRDSFIDWDQYLDKRINMTNNRIDALEARLGS